MNVLRRLSLSRKSSKKGAGDSSPPPTAVAVPVSNPPVPATMAAAAPTTPNPAPKPGVKTIQMEGPILLGGVSLRYIMSLMEKGEFQEEWTMNEVCGWVMNHTATEKLSLLEMLASSPETSHHVKEKADVFVSYVWSYNFREMVAVITDDLAPNEDVFVWLDSFCVNQHVRDNMAREQWMRTFEQALVRIGKAWVVPMPWKDPKNVKRSWCAFELLAMARNGVPNEIKMSKKERGDLKGAMVGREISLAFLNSFFSDVDIRKAEAFKAEDREAIAQLIAEYETTNGTGKVNHIVLESLKRWLLEVADEAGRDVKGIRRRPMRSFPRGQTFMMR